MPQQVGHLYLWRRGRDMRLCHPWPARIAPAIAVRKSFPTIFVEPVLIPAQAINKNAPTSGASLFMAERQGFEPWNTREDVTGIPVQRLRPLGHLSKTFVRSAESLVEGDPDW